MDGKTLLERLQEALNEDSTSGFLNDKNSYFYLWEAANEFVSKTNIFKSSQDISTVADQGGYTLNADFAELYLRDFDIRFIVKYNDGSINSFIPYKDYNEIIYEDNTTSVAKPSFFTVIDDTTLDTRLSSTTTSAGAKTAGECTLTDTTADFSDVSAGDTVHNTDDGSSGIVLSKTSNTVLVTALFGGTADDWSNGDAYVIQPQGRMKIELSPPPSNSSHTVTLFNNPTVPPVFSDYGMYRIPLQYINVIIKYAAWLYKYRDREPDFGDAWYKYYDREIRRINSIINNNYNRNKLRINLKNRGR